MSLITLGQDQNRSGTFLSFGCKKNFCSDRSGSYRLGYYRSDAVLFSVENESLGVKLNLEARINHPVKRIWSCVVLSLPNTGRGR